MSSGPILPRPLPPSPPRLETDEERTALFRKGHAKEIDQVHQKSALRRFVAPIHPQPSRREGQSFTEADLDRFLASLDRRLFPSALAGDEAAVAIGHEFWAARSAAWTEVCRRLGAERQADESTLTAVERAITKTLLVRDRTSLLNFVGLHGVEPLELALALWSSHAHGWFSLATDAVPLWPRVTAWLAAHGSNDGIERGPSRFQRFSGERVQMSAPTGRSGMRPYQLTLKDE